MYVFLSILCVSLHLITLTLSFLEFRRSGLLISIPFTQINSIRIEFTFLVDWVSCSFRRFVLLISGIVILYSNFYISGDTFMTRFLIILFLFVSSIIFIVFRVRIFSFIIGWDGLGVVSFCLVIYYADKSALVSGLVTVYTNRLGDIFIIIAMYFMLESGSWLNSSDLWSRSFYAALFIFIASLTKRAQYPFSSWLPAAIAAPTPISSLVHSSTLVTAGVYLVIRFNYLLDYLITSSVISFLSSLTMMLAGLAAFIETDAKKIIAISTLSQLGLMFFVISIGDWVFSFFHLLVHATFKSLIFLSCGGFIRRFWGDQDIRSSGRAMLHIPIFRTAIWFSSLGLIGIPFLAGFYSKDAAIDLMNYRSLFSLSYILFIIRCILTVIYSLRLLRKGLNIPTSSSSVMNTRSPRNPNTSLFVLRCWILVTGPTIATIIVEERFILTSSPLKPMGLLVFVFGILSFLSFDPSKTKKLSFYIFSLRGLITFYNTILSKKSIKINPIVENDYLWVEKIEVEGFSNLVKTSRSESNKLETISIVTWISIIIAWLIITIILAFN